MISTLMQGIQFFFSLPWTIWDWVTNIIHTTLKGYGVLEEKEVSKDDQDEAEEEGESKEEDG